MPALTDITHLNVTAELLRQKIDSRAAHCAVIGLGYVGLPLAVELGNAGFRVTGIDKDPEKVAAIDSGRSYIGDVDSQRVSDLASSGKLRATCQETILRECDTVSICVPTPLRKTKEPDLTFVMQAADLLTDQLHPGMLVILESTTYPGTTEEAILPVLERSGLRVGHDFFLCFSPERVDPGNSQFTTRTIPKVIGGVTPFCTQVGALFYSQVMDQVVPVSSTRVAEMVKLLENTFRMINIGLANEMALMCRRMGINVWEVIEAAATKPFGFMAFYPGPGLGGHCIPVDPHYLSWKSKQAGSEARFIELAAHINSLMPQFVVETIQSALNDRSKPVKGSKIHVVGVAYKKNVADTRESPARDIIALLEKYGGIVSYTDPLVPQLQVRSSVFWSQPLDQAAQESDCSVIVTDHAMVDYHSLVQASPLIVDTRNVLKDFKNRNILRL